VLVTQLTAQVTSHDVVVELPLSKSVVGETYIDSAFGTKVTRLTDAVADGAAGYVCYYSKLDPFNADESKILFYQHEIGWWWVYDLQDKTQTRIKQIFNPQTDPQPRWHPTDQNKIRFFYANELRELDIKNNLVTTLSSFPGYEFVTNHDEGNLSIDGNIVAICGRNWPWFTGLSEFFTYNLATGFVSSKITTTGHNVDWVSMSPSGKYFVTMTEGDQPQNTEPPYQWFGLDVYDANTMQIYPLAYYKYTDHGDIGIENGKEFFVVDNAESDYLDRLRHIEKYDFDTGAKTDLLGLDWSMTNYVSCRNFNSEWSLITTEAKPELCGKPVPFKDEIFLLKNDGSGAVKRLVHHRSQRYNVCDYGNNVYWAQANGVISHSGRYILFTSNWREVGAPEDVYLMDLSMPSYVNMRETTTPNGFTLTAYPNPFKAYTTITASKTATLTIYDVMGRKVFRKAIVGSQEVRFTAPASGIYFAVISREGLKKMMRLTAIK